MAPTSLDSDFRIRNMGSELYLDIYTLTSIPNPNQYDYRGSIQAKWHITKRPDGYFTIQSAYNSQYYLGISSTAIGSSIELYSGISNNTLWKIYVKDNGEIFFEPKNAPGRVMAAADNSAGSELILKWMSDSLENRNVWKFEVQSPVAGESQEDSWLCWVASARAYAQHYGTVPNDRNQANAVSAVKNVSGNIGGNIADTLNAVEYYLTGATTSDNLGFISHENKRYGEATLIDILNNGHIIWISRHAYDETGDQGYGHASVIVGYTARFVQGSIQFHYILLDPWPENYEDDSFLWGDDKNTCQKYTWTYEHLCKSKEKTEEGETYYLIWDWIIIYDPNDSFPTIIPYY